MRIGDVLLLTTKNITYRKLRSWLTILGIVIGIAAVVGLVGLGDTIKGAITSQLAQFGADKLVITPGLAQPTFSRSVSTTGGQPGLGQGQATLQSAITGAKNITLKEAQAISKLPYVLAVSPVVQRTYDTRFMKELSRVTMQFVDPNAMKIIEDPEIVEGRWLESNDKFSCVLGNNIARGTFQKNITVGDLIEINGKSCKVVGILKKEGGFLSIDNYIVINIGAIKSFDDSFKDSLTYVYVKAISDTRIFDVENEVVKLLKTLHNTIEEDFTIINFASVQETVSSITGLITAFLGGIAAISLLVGAIGISNTMFTSVMERTREIGILKAIGAKNRDIEYMYISEAGIMSLIGGMIGILLGMIMTQGIIKILPMAFALPQGGANLKFVLNPELMISVLGLSLIIGVLSGILPARRASGLNPIEAIWYE